MHISLINLDENGIVPTNLRVRSTRWYLRYSEYISQAIILAPTIEKNTINPIVPEDSPCFSTSIRGTLAPIVVFTQAKNVVFSPVGNGVSWSSGTGALLFDTGMLEGSAAVLL